MNKDLSAHLTKKEDPVITELVIETSDLVTKDVTIVQQEPTPSKDNTPKEEFLL